jgi:CARDB
MKFTINITNISSRRGLTLIGVFWAMMGSADSPLSSSYFAPAYREVPEIAAMMTIETTANEPLLLDALTSVFILDAYRPLDIRLAMVNALGFGQTTNVELIVQYVATKYEATVSEWHNDVVKENWVGLSKKCMESKVSPQDMLVMAYVSAMGSYTNPRCALPFLFACHHELKGSETAAWIRELITSQLIMESDPCEVYILFAELQLKTYSKDPLREESKRRIMDYIGLYEEACLPDPYSEAYYFRFPVFDTLQSIQKMNAAKYVDLQFVGDVEGVLPFEDHVDNEGTEGGKIAIEVRNSGNVINIPTNLFCVLFIEQNGKEDRLVRQTKIPPIKPNQTDVVSLFLPGIWWQAGSGRMEIYIDEAEQIVERNETNNHAVMGPPLN